MIQVYDPNNTDFNKNGDMVIQPSVAELSIELNGIANIEMEFSFDEYGRWEYVVKDSIIRCHTPWDKDKGQLFRVYETEKDMGRYKVYGKHIIADLMTTTAKDLNNEDVMIVATGQTNGQGAITKLLVNTGFIGHSNITKLDSVRWERKLITEALLSDDENSFMKRWGGELFYNNFDVYMNTKIGGNYGVKISYGKNLDSIIENINRDGVITRIIPIGANGIRLTGLTPWVDSVNISKYPKPLEKVIEFNNVKVKENPEDEDGFATIELARAELIRLSKLMFTQEHIDTPIVNIKTSMVDISQTLEYKTMGYGGLEEVNLGDTVICSHYKLGIETEARCIGYKWNILTERMIDIEIGDVTKNFFDKQNDMSNAVAKILDGDTIKAGKIAGIINALQTKFKAQRSIAQPQEVRAMLFEDSVIGSPSYGATCIGSMGLQIASSRTVDNKDWDWRTFITGGLVYADWLVGNLKTVLIENADASFQIDLKGTGGAKFFTNGKKAMEISKNSLKLYNWKNENDYIGSLGALIVADDVNKPLIGIWNDVNSALSIGYQSALESNSIPSYIEFDKYNILGAGKAIRVRESIEVGTLHFNENAWFTTSGLSSWIGTNSSLSVAGNFDCGGTKTRVVNTSQGKVKLNAFETPNAMFSDYGHDVLDQNGICTVFIDSLFLETVSTEQGYDVFLTKYGKGDIWIEDRELSSFLVLGEPNLKFCWNIVAKQKGYEYVRLEKFDEQLIQPKINNEGDIK